MNKVMLIGRLTKDPELRYASGSGVAVTNFTVAVNRRFAGPNGQKEADFIPVVCFKQTAEYAANYFNKGKLVAISGSIQTRNYQAQDGTKKYVTEVIADEVQSLQSNNEGGAAPAAKPNNVRSDSGIGNEVFMPVEDDEEIPF